VTFSVSRPAEITRSRYRREAERAVNVVSQPAIFADNLEESRTHVLAQQGVQQPQWRTVVCRVASMSVFPEPSASVGFCACRCESAKRLVVLDAVNCGRPPWMKLW